MQTALARRRLLLGLAALASGFAAQPARAAAGGYDEHELDVPGEKLARRCLVLVPSSGQGVRRLLVLFHGLAETSSEPVGIRAWADRYGLVTAAGRLANPPVTRTVTQPTLLTEERLAELNAALAADPFQGLAIACPYTPNVFRQPSTPAALDRYAEWVADGVLPEARKLLSLPSGARAIGVDGVSLGGYVSLEVFLRRPDAFGAVGALQAAIGESLCDAYALRFEQAFARAGARPLRIATSAWDPERPASERLVKKLRARGLEVTFSSPPGGHDQGFLRENGSLELLFYYDRTLPHGGPRPEGR
jgi:poly(3-hydroxybutyrate) depolymerase